MQAGELRQRPALGAGLGHRGTTTPHWSRYSRTGSSRVRRGFINRNGALLCETHSSTLNHPQARILFLLERPYTDGLAYRIAQQVLAWRQGFTD
ncbi:MAG: hypothetical protein O2909_11675 [Chloroflexi bacterium]|nr:hypothetical protein [Chloroflexota bacterium]MDA1220083.1 hypothetical protein [Chloroflexota bacterium]